MDTIFDLLADVLKDLVCGAVNQLHYSFCFNGFVKELEKEEDNFTETKRSVEDRVTHARKQTLKTAEVMQKWLENANIGAEEVNRLLKEAKAKKSCCFGYCPNWIWRYCLGKKLANKKMDLQNIIQEGLKNSSILVSEFIWMIDRLKESDGVSTSNNELPSSRVKTSQPIQVNLAEMIIIIISLN
ncbi:hypothetical protein ACSQ67_017802 [Phaseolus vulgaris]